MVASTSSEEHLNYKVSTTDSQANVRWQIAQRNHYESQSSIEALVWALLNESSLSSCRQERSIFKLTDHIKLYMYIFSLFFFYLYTINTTPSHTSFSDCESLFWLKACITLNLILVFFLLVKCIEAKYKQWLLVMTRIVLLFNDTTLYSSFFSLFAYINRKITISSLPFLQTSTISKHTRTCNLIAYS